MRILLLLFLFFCFQQVSQGVEIQYKYKIVSEHIDDGFASALATAPNKLAILAARDKQRGTLYVGHGTTLTPPLGSQYKENILDMNEHFIVAGCRNPETVLVYQARSLFELKARIPVSDGHELNNVRITKKSTIVVVRNLNDGHYPTHCDVMTYHYDGFGSWHLSQTLSSQCYIYYLGSDLIGLAVSESYLAVQGFGIEESVIVFKKEKKRWVKYQTLEPSPPVRQFGDWVAMDGEKLAISTSASTYVFTYHLRHTTGKWIQDSALLPPGEGGFPIIAKDLLVVTINDYKQPEISGLVYKFSEATNFSDGEHTWEHVATLKTNGDPMKLELFDWNTFVRIENGIVYTGRWGRVGKVFLYDISRMTEN